MRCPKIKHILSDLGESSDHRRRNGHPRTRTHRRRNKATRHRVFGAAVHGKRDRRREKSPGRRRLLRAPFRRQGGVREGARHRHHGAGELARHRDYTGWAGCAQNRSFGRGAPKGPSPRAQVYGNPRACLFSHRARSVCRCRSIGGPTRLVRSIALDEAKDHRYAQLPIERGPPRDRKPSVTALVVRIDQRSARMYQ